jgi:hypothetical protein
VPVALGVLLVSVVAGLDYLTGPGVSVDLLYVLAVMAVTWVGCRRHAVLVAVLAAAEGLAAQTAIGSGAALTLPAVWNALTDLVVLTLVAVLVDSLHRALEHQRHLATVDFLTGALNRRAFGYFARTYPVDHPEAEALLMLHQAGLRILEVPIRMRQRTSGQSLFGFVRSALYPLRVVVGFAGILFKDAGRL